MPVILLSEDHTVWLDPNSNEAPRLLELLRPFPTEEMEAVEVNRVVNNTRHEGPECLSAPS